MNNADRLGVVLGTQDATPLDFWFSVADGASVQLDDIVAVDVPSPADPARVMTFYGVVDQVRRRHEGVQFDGDTQLVADGLMPAHVSYAAHVRTTRIEPESFIPPAPGDPVRAATGGLLDAALFHDRMEHRLPAGVLRNGLPSYLNLEFIDGRKGAHVNISGISGVATKTSYALFLLYSLFNARRGSGSLVLDDPAAAKAVVFNVKGTDLFYLDRPNNRFGSQEAEWQARTGAPADRYGLLGLSASAFTSVQVRAPAVVSPARGGDLIAEGPGGAAVLPYCWSVLEFARDRLLPYALADRDAMSNLGMLVDHVVERLHRLASERGQKGPWLLVDEWRDAADATGALGAPLAEDDAYTSAPESDGPTGARVRAETLHDLVGFLEYKLLLQGRDDSGERGGDPAWTGNQPRGTREALIRRLRGAARHLARLVRGDVTRAQLERARPEILDAPAQVHVIDIHSLAPLAQMFVVGVLLRQVFERKETVSGNYGKVFVVLDELNKYAPADGDSPIKETMLDIAERGRSLGVILIGAQQTASEVERRVVANAAVRVAGRLDAAEAERSEYRFMPASVRARSTILTPGTMIVQQPDVPVPLLLTFPFPAWATRREEATRLVSDEAFDDLAN